jgi:hypothetical protein
VAGVADPEKRRQRWRALLLVAVALLVAGLKIADGVRSRPTSWEQIVAMAPAAYRGACAVEGADKSFWYPRGRTFRQAHVGSATTPVPCYNLVLAVGFEEPKGRRFMIIHQNDGLTARPTDTLRVTLTPLRRGGWRIAWSVKPGVDVEWLYGEMNDTHQHEVSGRAGSVVWHPSPHEDYPGFALYANDRSAKPGWALGVTGPPVPYP